MNTKEQIENLISQNNIVLFMKGTKDFPQCGFSSVVSSILQKLDLPFQDINVLEDPEIRQTIKEFSDWPTIPQLYIKGEFIGGCDIVKEMYQNGDLQKLLEEKNILTRSK
ncbi:MAG: Grx4 family monothiol glutaredoxin [Rickettsiaceae bacterium]|nr:Grx4 family monothiol glutaredoxin [Rickettsiaceae bacterium]